MSIYMDKLPSSCECCPCNDDNYRCGATGESFDYYFDEHRMTSCPLKQLSDVRENVKGQWKLKTTDLYGLADKVTAWANYCSICGYHYGTPYNFCPHCGAEMKKGEEDE